MHHGELILRQPRKDELYWICTFVVSLIPWGLSRAYLTQETVTAGVLATLAVLVAVRVTLLKNWNVRRVAWTMDDRALELDGRTILIGDIQSAFLRQHTMTRGVWTLTIWTKTPLRLAGVAVGPQRLASLHSLRQLSAALDRARGVEPQV
ncbi:hypothetical protein L0P50_17605 [Lawsonibacter sp. DFI.6.74]|uniref:Uncharacterized protein n=1 Tax=Flintibacter faecis TaxID=2763047 RepID=A0A8J6MB00_9FIRM|nr:hypothetical protein [Flintibacter faecis]MBC5717300.1 hypothetical protein [Flintibacter faecis]MCG4470685.1 hypothetical protein [Lawsonibacter sp. DFI.6.74]MCG4774947.1 hypothetical protein [Lawsonibacter sp. DFI.5.51]